MLAVVVIRGVTSHLRVRGSLASLGTVLTIGVTGSLDVVRIKCQSSVVAAVVATIVIVVTTVVVLAVVVLTVVVLTVLAIVVLTVLAVLTLALLAELGLGDAGCKQQRDHGSEAHDDG